MPQQRYYFRYIGPPQNGITVLGFLIVTRSNYQGSQDTIQQYFSPSDQHMFQSVGYVRSGRPDYFTFCYDTDLDAIERVYIETRSAADRIDVTDSTLHGLLMRLQSEWFRSMQKLPSAEWRERLPGGTKWPYGLAALSPIGAQRTGGTFQPTCLLFTCLIPVMACILVLSGIIIGPLIRGFLPVTIVVPTSVTERPAAPFTVPTTPVYIVVTAPAQGGIL